jgi:hypothetical protein
MMGSWVGTHQGRRVRINYQTFPPANGLPIQWEPIGLPAFDESEAPDVLIVALVIGLEYGPPPWSDILEWVMARYQEHLASQPTQPPSFVPKRQRIPHPGKQPPSQVEPKALHVPHPRRDNP